MGATIRRALVDDAAAASRVAVAAKAHWGYAPSLLAAWEAELQITPACIASHAVFVAELDEAIVGVCVVEAHATHRELTHLWVAPSAQGRGVGTALLSRARDETSTNGGPLRVESDPNAALFYVRAGGVRVGEVPAPIPSDPNRTLPVFEFME